MIYPAGSSLSHLTEDEAKVLLKDGSIVVDSKAADKEAEAKAKAKKEAEAEAKAKKEAEAKAKK